MAAASSALLHRLTCCDPLISTMALLDCAEYRHADVDGVARVPPLVPMVMQMVNIHNDVAVRIPCNEPLILSMPNWHRRGKYDDSYYDGEIAPVDEILAMQRLVTLRIVKPLAGLALQLQ